MEQDIRDDRTFAAHGTYYKFSKDSLSFLSNKSLIRKILVWIITWKYFELFIVLVIVLNSVFLGIYDYTIPES